MEPDSLLLFQRQALNQFVAVRKPAFDKSTVVSEQIKCRAEKMGKTCKKLPIQDRNSTALREMTVI